MPHTTNRFDTRPSPWAAAPEVRAEFARAQQQADQLAGPPLPWAGAADKRLRRRIAIGCVALLAGVAGLGSALRLDAGHERPTKTGGHAVPVIRSTPAHAASAEAPATHSSAATKGVAPQARGRADVRRIGRDLAIDMHGVDITQAVRLLAAATQSTVHIEADRTPPPKPVTWSWRGHDGLDAWRSLLGPHFSYASRCEGLRCELWLAGEIAPAASAPPVVAVAPAPAPPAPVAPAVTPEDEIERLAFGDAP